MGRALRTVLLIGVLGSTAVGGHAADAGAAHDLATFDADGVHRFHDDDPGFSIEYPWDWLDSPDLSPPLVLQATAPDQLPVLRVAVLDEPWWLPLAFATRAASTQLSSLGRDIELLDEEVVDLAGGGRANVGELTWTANVGIGVAVRSLYVHRFHEGRWVVVNLTVADRGEAIPEPMRAIALSLSVDDTGR